MEGVHEVCFARWFRNTEGIARRVPGVWVHSFPTYFNCCTFFLNTLNCRSPSGDQLIFISRNGNSSFVTIWTLSSFAGEGEFPLFVYVTGKGLLDEMVNCNSSLTNTIATLTDTNSRLSKKVETLTPELDKKGGSGGEVTGRGTGNYWPNRKRETWHKPDDCFELENNKDKLPSWWKSCLKWQRGTDREGLNASSTNNTSLLIKPHTTRSHTIAIYGKLPANFIIPLLPLAVLNQPANKENS